MVLVLLTAACAPNSGGAEAPAAPIEPYVMSADLCGDLPDGGPDLPQQQSAVPADLDVSWVLECTQGPPALSGKPEVQVRRADGPAAELLAALHLPSATTPSDACTAEFLLPFYVALITADGRAIAPVIPVDGCAKPRREVLAALGKLPFK